MRYFANGFWTPPKDRRLQKLEAEGRSGKEIAERLGTSRNAVVARSARLRGITFPSNIRREKALRAQAAARLREKNRRIRTALYDMRTAMARGVDRDAAICAAVKAGATYAAIGAELGVSRQRVHQILSENG
jgi:biotin operon repressor